MCIYNINNLSIINHLPHALFYRCMFKNCNDINIEQKYPSKIDGQGISCYNVNRLSVNCNIFADSIWQCQLSNLNIDCTEVSNSTLHNCKLNNTIDIQYSIIYISDINDISQKKCELIGTQIILNDTPLFTPQELKYKYEDVLKWMYTDDLDSFEQIVYKVLGKYQDYLKKSKEKTTLLNKVE